MTTNGTDKKNGEKNRRRYIDVGNGEVAPKAPQPVRVAEPSPKTTPIESQPPKKNEKKDLVASAEDKPAPPDSLPENQEKGDRDKKATQRIRIDVPARRTPPAESQPQKMNTPRNSGDLGANRLARCNPPPEIQESMADANHNAILSQAEKGEYIIGDMLAKGAESVLYRTTGGLSSFCVKTIRNCYGALMANAKMKGNKSKIEVAYKSKVRHLRNEFTVGCALQEPGEIPVVRIYALRKIRNLGFEAGYDLVMELLHGYDMASKQSKSLTLLEKIDIMHQTAKALQFIHSKNFVHLDMKPSNIMIVPQRKVKLIDFGVSVTLGHKSHSVTGTTGYLSPEQIAKETLDLGTDVFAFGITFGVIFGAQLLRQTTEELKKKDFRADSRYMLEHDENPMMQVVPELDHTHPELARMLSSCTIPKRHKRFDSMHHILTIIETYAKKNKIPLSSDKPKKRILE